MQSTQQLRFAEELTLRGAIWALVGMLFGFLFVVIAESVGAGYPEPYGAVLATVGAAALTSLFYGSMRLTVMVANFTFIAMLVYTWQAPATLGLEPLVFIGGGLGMAVGAAYGLKDKRSRVFCAEAKLIAGAVSGIIAGIIGLLATAFFDGVSSAATAIVVAPIAILAYVRIAGWFISRCHHLLPAGVNGAFVGLAVGCVTGLVFLLMAGNLEDGLLGSQSLQNFAGRVADTWGVVVIGCSLVCFPIGVIRGLMKTPWYDM